MPAGSQLWAPRLATCQLTAEPGLAAQLRCRKGPCWGHAQRQGLVCAHQGGEALRWEAGAHPAVILGVVLHEAQHLVGDLLRGLQDEERP